MALSERLSAEQLGQLELFAGYSEKFLEFISPDVSVATWSTDSVLFEEGSYLDLAFVVLEGEVELYLAKQLERAASDDPIFDGTRATRIEMAGGTTAATQLLTTRTGHRSDESSGPEEPALLATMDFDLPAGGHVWPVGPGGIFGEIGALNGWPQSVTARTRSECRVLQIRRPALRQMKRQSRDFKNRVDAVYRERSLLRQIKACPLFVACSDAAIAELVESVELVSCDPDEVVQVEGSPAEALYLVRSGFMKLSQRVGQGQVAVSYLSKGMMFGEVELMLPERTETGFTLSSVGYSELVRIALPDMRRMLRRNPQIEAQLWAHVVERIKETGSSRVSPQQSEFIEFALRKGLVQGNSLLVIDLEACTRCDDCVRACASTHGGRPRFVREGDRYANVLIAKSCYHCQDPVCLIGCPTGAIRRANVGDVVEIRENICIGCSTCANNCPYDAIMMQDTETVWPDNALPRSLRGAPRLVASKCDLCYTSADGPACVRNCPQHCAIRVGSIEEFEGLLNRSGH